MAEKDFTQTSFLTEFYFMCIYSNPRVFLIKTIL